MNFIFYILFLILRNFNRIFRSSYNYYNYVSGNYLLLVAHPDDESMFFAPTLLNLKGRIRILCLSKGNTQFVYSKRELEMIKLCKNYNFELILYNFFDNDKWDENVISDILEYTFLTSPFKTLITFDNFGLSYHQNHISCFLGAEKFRNNKSSRPNFHIQFWYLNSKNLFTKYILNFSKNDFILGFDNYFQALVMMKYHWSQLLWFRYLYLFFSNYTSYNSYFKI